MIPDPEIKKKI